ncbi:hypothetical protein GCM10022248_64000 [Nonomuraea soli]
MGLSDDGERNSFMMRRLAAGAAAAALGAAVLAGAAAPASAATHGYDGNTSLSFDAGPEPIRRGADLSLQGKLSVECDEDYIDGIVAVFNSDKCDDDERWHRLGWKKVVILFQPAGSHRWDYVDTVRTDRNGYFYTEETAYVSGTWRAVFEGSRYLEGSEGRDWVKVYGHRH